MWERPSLNPCGLEGRLQNGWQATVARLRSNERMRHGMSIESQVSGRRVRVATKATAAWPSSRAPACDDASAGREGLPHTLV